jgi:hypothetical protein
MPSFTNPSTSPGWPSFSKLQVQDGFGPGQRLVLEGRDGDLAKTVAVTLYDAFPTVAVFEVSYRNQGSTALPLTGWRNHGYTLDAQAGAGQSAFWGYFSGSSEKRRNWTRPLRPGTREDNCQGMNGDDYGGGTPVADLWDRRGGLAVGHLEPRPVLLSLPMAMPDAGHATLAVQATLAQPLAPGEVFRTPRTLLAVHRGDCFQALVQYRGLMAIKPRSLVEFCPCGTTFSFFTMPHFNISGFLADRRRCSRSGSRPPPAAGPAARTGAPRAATSAEHPWLPGPDFRVPGWRRWAPPGAPAAAAAEHWPGPGRPGPGPGSGAQRTRNLPRELALPKGRGKDG